MAARNFNLMVGEKFGHLLVLSVNQHAPRTRVVVRCDCGNEKETWAVDVWRGASRSCGCMIRGVVGARREPWAETEIAAGLFAIGESLGRMPSVTELRASGRNDLAVQATRRGGMKAWAARLGLALSGAETHRGQAIERVIADELRAMGFTVEPQTCKSPFDLLVDGVRVDVKSGAATGPCGSHTFGISKVPATCDLYIACCVDGDNEIIGRYYIPASAAQVRTLSIAVGGKYARFLDDVTQLRALVQSRAA